MANCENLCTAAKCQELELRILELEGWLNALEGRLINLEVELDEHVVKLDEHVTKPTGQAHTWDIGLWMSVFYDSDWNDINVRLQLIDSTESVLANVWQYTDSLPFLLQEDLNNHINQGVSLAHNWDINLEPQIGVRTDETGNYLDYSFSLTNGTTAFRTVNGYAFLPFIRTELFQLHLNTPIPEAHAYNPTADDVNIWLNQLDFFFRIDDLANNDWDFVITIGDRTRSQILDLPLLSGGGGGGDGGSTSTGEETEQPPATLSLNGSYDIANNDINITVAVNGKSASTTINLDAMPFDNIQNTLDEILNSLTLELSGQYEVGETITNLETAPTGEVIVNYSRYRTMVNTDPGFLDTTFTGTGLEGLHQAFLALDKKITILHQDLARAIEPQLPMELFYPKDCLDLKTRADFSDEEWDILTEEEKNKVLESDGDKATNFYNNHYLFGNTVSTLDGFSPAPSSGTLLGVPAFWANLIGNNLTSQQIDGLAVNACFKAPNTETETVTIVASPEVQANVRDGVLVLDFTTTEAFPELNENKSKWRVQIPAPIEDISWDAVKDIRWFRGGQYGKMKFVGRQNYTAGWFRSKDDAEIYFNQIRELTTLEVENIKFIEQTNAKISPQIILTRVYRAFVAFVGENGEPSNALTQVFNFTRVDTLVPTIPFFLIA